MSTSLPAVSIITPAYKRVDYLRAAIDSVISQNFTDFELLVCDDSAEPKIEKLCGSYGDPRIIYRANKQRLGIAMNNLSGFQAARSDLLTNLDDDDLWTPDFLEKLVPVMLSNPNICLTFSDHWLVDSTGKRMIAESDAQTTQCHRDILDYGLVREPKHLIYRKSIPLAMAAIFRKSAIDWSSYSEQAGGAYDFFLSSCLVSSGMDIFYVPERLTEYRVHDGSATATRNFQNSLETLFVAESIYKNPYFKDFDDDNRKICFDSNKGTGNAYLKQGKVLSAIYHYSQAMKYRFWR